MNVLSTVGLMYLKGGSNLESSMESNEEIIARLKFIGHIQKDEKINVRHVNKQPNTIYTKFSRTFLYPDNRNNSLKFVRDVVSRTFDILESYIHHENFDACRSLVADLLKAKQGITNLKYTYGDDTKFSCDLDVLIEVINSRLSGYKEKYSDLFESGQESKK